MPSVNRITAAVAAAKPRTAAPPPPAAFMARAFARPAPDGFRVVWGVDCPDCGGYRPTASPTTMTEFVAGAVAGGHAAERRMLPGDDWPEVVGAVHAAAAEAARLLGRPVRAEVGDGPAGPVVRVLPVGGWL